MKKGPFYIRRSQLDAAARRNAKPPETPKQPANPFALLFGVLTITTSIGLIANDPLAFDGYLFLLVGVAVVVSGAGGPKPA